MAKDQNRYVRPGRIASEHYLQVRENRIKENKKKFDALGLYQFTCPRGEPSVMSGHGMTEVRNRDGEDDYIPSNHDDEYSLSSSSNEVLEMPFARSSRRGRVSQERNEGVSSAPDVRDHPASSEHEEVVGSTSQDHPSILTPEEPTTSCAVAGANTRTRGLARGFQSGNGDADRPVVLIPKLFNAPVGPFGTKFAGEAGCRVRRDVLNLHHRWAKIPVSEKAPIVASLKNKFDIRGDPESVESALNTKLAELTRGHRYRLHLVYKDLISKNSPEYARNHPPSHISPGTWEDLIDYWLLPKSIAVATSNKANRNKSKSNHVCGSKSISIRAKEKMDKNEGSLGSFPEFYKETHYNTKKGKWATPECERLHTEMERDEEWQKSQPDVAPLTAEQMSIKHLRARSGVVKGIGIRPSSSLRTTATSLHANDEAVRHLVDRAEQELQQKMEERVRGEVEERVRSEVEEQLRIEREKRLELEQKFNAILEYMKTNHRGLILPLTMAQLDAA